MKQHVIAVRPKRFIFPIPSQLLTSRRSCQEMEKELDEYVPGNKVAFGFGALGDSITYQVFTFLVFTFYYAVVGIDINLVTLGFVTWSVWNAINDPLAGLVSDKTNTKRGRRIPYIAITFLPLSLLMFILWTPPVGSLLWSFIYFVGIIMLFDTVYTFNSLNLTALFPEMYLTEEERTSANNIRQIFLIVGLLIAFLVPTFLISDLSAKDTPANIVIGEYQQAGIILAVIVAVVYLIALKWGVSERKEFKEDWIDVPSWGDAFKHTLGNRTFHAFLLTNTMNWYVFGLIPTIIPIYGQFVLGIGAGESIMLGILLAAAFVSGGFFMALWKYIVNRWGNLRKAWIASMALWIAALVPLFFVTDMTIALVLFAFNGIGLSGSLYLKDLVMADIIDEDEVKTGVRREGAYFGVNALVMRLAVILVFVSINLVFNSVGWRVFLPEEATAETLLGLRLLMGIFPAIALAVGIAAFSRYQLVGDRLKEVKSKRDDIHSGKQEKTKSDLPPV
ncbi:MFS transporter [Candidatus Thorarchaeota archaeon]|nr:MAG: MFS transporter [Candidatus Thorarchaeota archaeon]